MMRKWLMVLTMVLGIGLVTAFEYEPHRSSAQDSIRKQPACTIFCGDGTFLTFGLGAKPCWGGPLPADTAGDHFKSLAPEDQASVCRSIEAAAASKSSTSKCPAFKTLLGLCTTMPPAKKCEPPRHDFTPPWFSGDADCQNRQRGTISRGQNKRNLQIESVTVNMCGTVINFDQSLYALTDRVTPTVYSFDVCCDTWKKAFETGSPCDVRQDIDCDGELNEKDVDPVAAPAAYPSDTDYVSNSPLTNLPFWKLLRWQMPSQSECKSCKWELVRVDYTCKDETISYQSTWKCPATAHVKTSEVGYTTNRATRCPVPPKRSWP